MARQLISVSAAAEQLGFSVDTIYRRISAGKLTRLEEPGWPGIRLDRAEVDRLFGRQGGRHTSRRRGGERDG